MLVLVSSIQSNLLKFLCLFSCLKTFKQKLKKIPLNHTPIIQSRSIMSCNYDYKFHLHNILCSQIVNTQHFMFLFMHSHHTNFIFHIFHFTCTSGWVIEQYILVIKILYSKKCSLFYFKSRRRQTHFFDRFFTHTQCLIFIWLDLIYKNKKNMLLDNFYRTYAPHSRISRMWKNCCRQWNIYEIFLIYTLTSYIHTKKVIRPHFKFNIKLKRLKKK